MGWFNNDFRNKYPFTDFHELNLSWFLNEFINLKEEVKNFYIDFAKRINEEVEKWLDNHPEATTTVLDHSLENVKLVYGTLGYVTPEMFGAVGDGVTDDSIAFSNAVDFAHTNNIPLVMEEKSYDAHDITSDYICDIEGNNATVNVGQKQFFYDTDVKIKDVTFVSTFAVDRNGNGGTFIDHANNVDTIILKNVKFVCRSASDALRGYIFFRALCNKLIIDGVEVYGAWRGIVLSNTSDIVSESYYINNVYGENVQTLIDVEGYISSIDYSGFLKNVTISNINLVNTANQKQNYTAVEGSDAVLVINVDGLNINNIRSIYAIERTIYCTNVINAIIDGVFTRYSQSVKVVGTQLNIINPNLSGYIKSTNILINNLDVRDATGGYALLMYEVDHATVNNILFQNSTSTLSDYCIGLTGVCSHINISHVRGTYSTRGVIYIYAVNGRANDITFVKVDDIKFDYPVGTGSYYGIRIEGTDSVFVRYISFDDVIFNEKFIKYSTSADCAGLIKANYTQNMVINNCEARFIKTLGTGINIDASTCSEIEVNGIVENPNTPCTIDFNASSGVYTVKQTLTRNNYSTQLMSMNQYTTTPTTQTKYRQLSTMLLAPAQPQVLSGTINSGHIIITCQTGYLEGYFTSGVFTQIHQAGSVGTSGTDIIFDASAMSLTLGSGAAINVSVEVIKNS